MKKRKNVNRARASDGLTTVFLDPKSRRQLDILVVVGKARSVSELCRRAVDMLLSYWDEHQQLPELRATTVEELERVKKRPGRKRKYEQPRSFEEKEG